MENKDNELIERAKNFHGKFDPLAVHNKLYLYYSPNKSVAA